MIDVKAIQDMSARFDSIQENATRSPDLADVPTHDA